MHSVNERLYYHHYRQYHCLSVRGFQQLRVESQPIGCYMSVHLTCHLSTVSDDHLLISCSVQFSPVTQWVVGDGGGGWRGWVGG